MYSDYILMTMHVFLPGGHMELASETGNNGTTLMCMFVRMCITEQFRLFDDSWIGSYGS